MGRWEVGMVGGEWWLGIGDWRLEIGDLRGRDVYL